MPRCRRRWRRACCQGPGRPMKPRMIGMWPDIDYFSPVTSERNRSGKKPLILTYDEFEALRLVDHLGLTQEEAAERMGISRGTVWRCLDSARKKLIEMLVEGKELVIGEDSQKQP